MTTISDFPRAGCVVEYMQDNVVQLAWILEESSGRLRLLTTTKRETTLTASRVLPWSGPEYKTQASRQKILEHLHKHQRQREKLETQVQALDIWEMALGEVNHAPTQWFAELIWNKPGHDEIAAMGRTLLAAKTYFKLQPPNFEVHPSDKVQTRLQQQTERREREIIQSGSQVLFKALWDRQKFTKRTVLPELDQDTTLRLKDLLLAAIAKNLNEVETKIWDSLRKTLPDHPHLALFLAEAWEIVTPHHNYLLDEAGYDWGDVWSRVYNDEIENQIQTFESARQEPELLPLVSIDSPTTRDIDDAFHIMAEPNGGFRLWIALARPNITWGFGSPLDQAVFKRATSLYLPEGTSHMMPECLSTDLFSLRAGQNKPAMLIEILLDSDGLPISVKPRCTWINVIENISYAMAEESLNIGNDERLALALHLAKKRIARRLECGASVIQKSEPSIILEGTGRNLRVRIELKKSYHKAELLISEFMILVNMALAGWASKHGIPVLHRTQDIALPQDAGGIFTEPSDIFGAVKLLPSPILELTPRRHAALGVPYYSPVSSPIRRYIDLINLDQIATFLEIDKPRKKAAELEALLPNLITRMQAVSQVQRSRPRYWKLIYLNQQKRTPHQAVLVDDSGPYPTLALPQYQINVRAPRQMLGDKLYLGQRFALVFGRVDALANEIKVLEAQEL